jgi:hypothetical protein
VRRRSAFNAKAVAACERFNAECPSGTPVCVRRDDGSIMRTKTRSVAWLLSDGTPVVMVEGISGGYLLERVTKEWP